MQIYVRNAWYVAGWIDELANGKPHPIRILDEPIAIYRRTGGQLVAFEDRCVHRLAPLSLGQCEGDNLRCMYHGLLYSPDGKVIEIPGQAKIPPTAQVRSYPVAERHSWIWVWMGDPEQADTDLIPPAVGLDDSDFLLGHGSLDYEAEAQLINDNLLDFSHLTYVHAASFGSSPEFASTLPQIQMLPRGVRYQRWIEDTPGSSFRKTEQPADTFMTYDFLVPGILLMASAAFPAGTAKRCDFDRPNMDEASSGYSFSSQAVTPTASGKARYFFSWGPHKDHGGEAQRDMLMVLAAKAFGEDKQMIEAQQQVLACTASPTVMPTAHDRAITLYSRLIKRLASEEKSRCG